MNAQPRKIQARGVELHFVEQGRGPALILVHGSLGDYRSWQLQIEPFSKRYHVIAYSRRYHFPNQWIGDGSDYSAALHGEDLSALITALGLESAFVVASSYGAYTTLMCALKHPDQVRAMVIGEPPIMRWLEVTPNGKPLYDAFMSGAWQPAGSAFRRGDFEHGIRAFLDGAFGMGSFDRLPPPARARMMENAREMQAETTARDIYPTFFCEHAQQIKTPTLLLTGELSPKLFHVIVDELERCLPNRKRLMIPATSHAIHTGNPQAYNEAVLAFLAEQ
jgi:non-heme chloroperoxidase